MEERSERYHPDMETLHRKFRTQPCFVCRILAGENERPQHFVYEDDRAIAFLDTFPRAYGYTLIAPREHRGQVTADFSVEEYLGLQRLIYRITEAVRKEVGAERMYIFTDLRKFIYKATRSIRAALVPPLPYQVDQAGYGPVSILRTCLPRLWPVLARGAGRRCLKERAPSSAQRGPYRSCGAPLPPPA